jgi:hypothetical protein
VGNLAKSKVLEEKDEGEFDSSLGLVTGATWWELAKNISPLLACSPEDRKKKIESWVNRIHRKMVEDDMEVSLPCVTPAALEKFVTTLLATLEKKYEGKSIAADVRRLTRKQKLAITDDGQYIRYDELEDTFWSLEYHYLFLDMQRERSGKGWLNAVDRCGCCGVFFIKQRSDQRFHSDACRTRAANRKAYQERRGQRPHTKRGRPRISDGGTK